jgi:hypothetical protein
VLEKRRTGKGKIAEEAWREQSQVWKGIDNSYILRSRGHLAYSTRDEPKHDGKEKEPNHLVIF